MYPTYCASPRSFGLAKDLETECRLGTLKRRRNIRAVDAVGGATPGDISVLTRQKEDGSRCPFFSCNSACLHQLPFWCAARTQPQWESNLRRGCADRGFPRRALQDPTSDRDSAVDTLVLWIIHTTPPERVKAIVFLAVLASGTRQFLWLHVFKPEIEHLARVFFFFFIIF